MHTAAQRVDCKSYPLFLENILRPAMYKLETECIKNAPLYIYRCFNAASIIAEYDYDRVPGYDSRFILNVARKARDVVGEWLD